MNMRWLVFGCLLVGTTALGFLGGLAILEHNEHAALQERADSAGETARIAPAATKGGRMALADSSRTSGAPDTPTSLSPVSDAGRERTMARASRAAMPPVAAPSTSVERADDAQAFESAAEAALARVVEPREPTRTAARRPVSIEKMIGQMLVIGFQGTSETEKWPRRVSQQLKSGQIGGVIFLKYNLKNRAKATQLTRLFANSGAEHPPLLTVDQEGGKVQRLAGNVGLSSIPSAQAVASRRTTVEAKRLYAGVARSLRKLGFNTNLGPVVDVNTNRSNPIIGKLGRSFSPDPKRVADYARQFVEAHRGEGVITALKHFPGHGSSKRDSHLGFVDISKTWSRRELEPYQRLVREDLADMVMIGHLFLKQYQDGRGGNTPATLSRKLITDVLRGKLGYDGVVISDDMEMGAIRKHYQPRDALRRAIKAGNDLLIVSNSAKPDMNMPGRIIAWLAEDAAKDPELARRIRESHARIVALKQKFLSPGSARPREDAAELRRDRPAVTPPVRQAAAARAALASREARALAAR